MQGENEKTPKGFERFTDDELRRAFVLLVSPEWLAERPVITAALIALDFTPEDVAERLEIGTQLNDGPTLTF